MTGVECFRSLARIKASSAANKSFAISITSIADPRKKAPSAKQRNALVDVLALLSVGFGFEPFRVIVVKATFTLARGHGLEISPEQRPIALADEYHGEPETSSLKVAGEVHLEKPGTDVLIVAEACPPGDKPAPVVDVGVSVRVYAWLLHKVRDEAPGWALVPMAMAGQPSDAGALRDAVAKALSEEGLLALGVVGRPADVPLLIDALADEAVVDAAARALNLVTGYCSTCAAGGFAAQEYAFAAQIC